MGEDVQLNELQVPTRTLNRLLDEGIQTVAQMESYEAEFGPIDAISGISAEAAEAVREAIRNADAANLENEDASQNHSTDSETGDASVSGQRLSENAASAGASGTGMYDLESFPRGAELVAAGFGSLPQVVDAALENGLPSPPEEPLQEPDPDEYPTETVLPHNFPCRTALLIAGYPTIERAAEIGDPAQIPGVEHPDVTRIRDACNRVG